MLIWFMIDLIHFLNLLRNIENPFNLKSGKVLLWIVTYGRGLHIKMEVPCYCIFFCYLFIALGEQRCTFVLKTAMGIHRLTGKSELFRKPGK